MVRALANGEPALLERKKKKRRRSGKADSGVAVDEEWKGQL